MANVRNLDIDVRVTLDYFKNDIYGNFFIKYNRSNGYDY
jgi:hypothetical protein